MSRFKDLEKEVAELKKQIEELRQQVLTLALRPIGNLAPATFPVYPAPQIPNPTWPLTITYGDIPDWQRTTISCKTQGSGIRDGWED